MRDVNKLGDEVETAIDKRQYKKAVTLADKFLEKYPTQPDAVFAVAKANNHVGNNERAIEYYTKCYEMDKTYYRAILNRGTVRYDNKDYKGAIKDFSLAIKITKYEHETVAQAYGNRAIAKYYSGDLKGALKDYNKVFEIEPNLPNIGQIHFNRGLCRYDLGDKVGADEDYNKARKLNPKWRLSPAYDLTYSSSFNGEHATTVNGEGKNPSLEDILAVAKNIGIKKKQAREVTLDIKEKCLSLID